MTSVRRALAFSFAERYVLIAISLLSNILLARLLTPEEIGIYSVSLAVIGIAQVLRDFGLGSFLIQQKNLNDAHIRTAFGFALLIGGSLFVVVYFAAPCIGRFYADERLIQTMRISSLNFLVLPFCSISLSLLRRAMAFKQLVTVTLSATVLGFVTMIGLAYVGFGPNSMAIGAVVTNIATGVGTWIARADRKLLLPGFSEWRVVLSFGGQSSLSSIVTTVAVDINDLALGKILGFAPVAMMSRAQGLTSLFSRDIMGAIRGVVFPAFAKAHRDGESLEMRYIASVTAVTVIAWPFYGFAALYARELIWLLFGPQWNEAASLVPLFCLAGAFSATSNLILSVIMAVGRIDLVTKSELLFQPLRAALIVAAAMIFESLFACAIAYLVALVFHTPYIYLFKARCIANNYQSLLSNLWLSAKVTLITLTLPVGLAIYAGVNYRIPASLLTLVVAAGLSVISWIIAILLFKHPITADPLFKTVTNKLRGSMQVFL